MTSRTVVTYPIVSALVHAEAMPRMGPRRQWQWKNQLQERFLREFFKRRTGEIGKIPEIESLASHDASEINAFLKKKGFGIELQLFAPAEFGVASVLDLLVEWAAKGEETTLTTSDQRIFPAVRIKKGLVMYRAEGHPNPVARIFTTSGDLVHVTILDNPPADDFDLVATAERLSEPRGIDDHEGVIFPMVDLNHEADISWLRGMWTIGEDARPVVISQAKQQTKLRMNEIGARVESAVAVGILRLGASSHPLCVIDRPFLVWFTRPGLSRPLFVGHIDYADWKKPASLA